MSDKKHIVIDARAHKTGAGRYVNRLLEHLQNLDSPHRYTVLLHPENDWRPQNSNFAVAFSKYKQFSLNPLEQIGFAWQLYQLKPDLVHFTMTQQPILYFGNIITTTHDLTMLRFVRPGRSPLPIFWVKKLGYRFLFWWGHVKSKKIIVPSRFVANDLSTHYPLSTSKITVCYEASEPPLPVAAKKPKMTYENYILHVGNVFPNKNIYRLVAAFEKLHKTHHDLHLVLVGKKEHYFQELDKYIALSPSKSHIHTVGFMEDSELKWLYTHAKAYVFPSLSEGFGLPGLEAMAHGCPVVSSNATCLPEIYDTAAYYFDPHDTEDMARAIDEVLGSKKLRKQLVEAGHKRLMDFSWRKMAQETLAIYNECLEEA
jgi:glycosyltransferase involved in cell wall biosynthesis